MSTNRTKARELRRTCSSYLIHLVLVLASGHVYAQENASNPLAAVNNTDPRVQYFDLDGPDRTEYWADGAYMLTPKLKLKYELYYWDSDVTGSGESDFETFHLKPIYFPTQGQWGSWKYKLAVGAEWIVAFRSGYWQRILNAENVSELRSPGS